MSHEQERYQVRFDWGVAGATAIGVDADVIVWVDAIPTSALEAEWMPTGAAVIEASMASAAAVARWLVDLQQSLGERIVIAVVAAGEQRESGELRFAAEDLLAAGAVIDRLAALGLDATSPEAAAAEGAYRHLARAVAHLMTASVTAASTPPAKESLRVDPQLEPADVVVRRQHRRG